MKKFLIFVSLVLIGGAALAAAELANNDKHYSWRYKMTVEIETPEGLKTGSAVREVNVNITPYPLDDRHPYRSKVTMKGEAVTVDLGDRGVLFAIITPDSYPEITDTFAGPPPLTPEGAEYYSRLENVKAPVEAKNISWMFTFSDLSDPKSVRLVKGGEFDVAQQKYIPVDNFEKIFGSGVKLKGVTVEMTDEPVTWEIEKWLPWLENLRGGYLHGGSTARGAPLGLYGGNFKLKLGE